MTSPTRSVVNTGQPEYIVSAAQTRAVGQALAAAFPVSRPFILGLSGYAGAGKDTAAAALVGVGFERRAFADTLRAFLLAVDPLIPSAATSLALGVRHVRLSVLVGDLGWDYVKRTYPEVRELLQRTGTEAGRQLLGENVWVDATLARLTGPTVVTDLRFPNEARSIKARGGLVVRIVRPGVGPANDHPSETAMDEYPHFDATLVNDSTPQALGEKLLAAVSGRR